MTGGEYYSWFDSSDTESRKILYQLENLGIARFTQEKENKKGWYKFKWELTQKGIAIVRTNKNLQKYWSDGKVVDFYNLLKELGSLENQQ